MGQLAQLLNPIFRASCFEDDFRKWALALSRYESELNLVIPDMVNVRLILSRAEGPMGTALSLDVTQDSTYQDIRASVSNFYTTNTYCRTGSAALQGDPFSTDVGPNQSSDQDVIPMDIGAFKKGKSFKRKGKRKSKGSKGTFDPMRSSSSSYPTCQTGKGSIRRKESQMQEARKGERQELRF